MIFDSPSPYGRITLHKAGDRVRLCRDGKHVTFLPAATAQITAVKLSRGEFLRSKGVTPPPDKQTFTKEQVEALDPKLAETAEFIKSGPRKGQIAATKAQVVQHYLRSHPEVPTSKEHEHLAHELEKEFHEIEAAPAGSRTQIEHGEMKKWYHGDLHDIALGFHTLLGYPLDPNHPKQVIGRLLLAIASNGAHPDQNAAMAVSILRNGGGDIARAHTRNENKFEKFREQFSALTGEPLPEVFPGETSAEKQLAAALWGKRNFEKLKRAGAGFKHAPGWVGRRYFQKDPDDRSKVNALIPLLDDRGAIQPKGFAHRPSVASGIEDLQRILRDHFKGDEEALRDFILHPQPISEIARIGGRAPELDYGPYIGTTKAPGGFIFGPKVGSFFQNISGQRNYLTVDRWVAQTLARLGIHSAVDPEEGGATLTARHRNLIWKVMQSLIEKHPTAIPDMATAQAIFWAPEQGYQGHYMRMRARPGNFAHAFEKLKEKKNA